MNVSRRSFCTTLAAGLAMGMFAGAGAAFAADDKAAELKTVEQGKLIMGTNATFPPYEYYDGDKIVGIDADVAALIADKLGLELEIEDMDFGAIITAVQTGKIDMGLAGITVNDERKKNVSFTDTYASGVQVIIVTEAGDIYNADTEHFFRKLASASDVIFAPHCSDENAVQIVAPKANIYIPLGDLVDFAKERARLNKEREKCLSEIDRVTKKLANEGFVAKAPAQLIESEKAKKVKLEEQLKGIDEAIAKLPE